NRTRSCAKRSACSYAPIWQPTANHATPVRVILRTFAQSLNVLAFCRRSASGTRQSFSVMSPFCTTRNAILVLIFSTEKPGLPFSTTKPLTSPDASSRAQMTFISERGVLPVHFFWLLGTRFMPAGGHVVSIPPDVAEPTGVLVSRKQPFFSQRNTGGTQRCFCPSSPHRKTAPAERPV